MNKEFQVHLLTAEGVKKAQSIAYLFDALLTSLQELVPGSSREMSIARTKLEESCFFVKKAMANDFQNQGIE